MSTARSCSWLATWRIIPLCKWWVTPIYQPWKGHFEGVPQPIYHHYQPPIQVMGWSSRSAQKILRTFEQPWAVERWEIRRVQRYTEAPKNFNVPRLFSLNLSNSFSTSNVCFILNNLAENIKKSIKVFGNCVFVSFWVYSIALFNHLFLVAFGIPKKCRLLIRFQ